MIPDHDQLLIQGVCLVSDGVETVTPLHAYAGTEGRRQ
jgi:hypothetical protein